ncbi:hypothetical protein P4I52_24400, partial [Escherichia coli]
MLEKSLATLFALLILATLINRFLLWRLPERKGGEVTGNDSNLLIVFYVQIMPDDFVMQLHR